MTAPEAVIWFLDNFFSWPNFAHAIAGGVIACPILQFVKWPKALRAALAIASGLLINALNELLVDTWNLDDLIFGFNMGAHKPEYIDIINGGIGALFVVLIFLFRNRK